MRGFDHWAKGCLSAPIKHREALDAASRLQAELCSGCGAGSAVECKKISRNHCHVKLNFAGQEATRAPAGQPMLLRVLCSRYCTRATATRGLTRCLCSVFSHCERVQPALERIECVCPCVCPSRSRLRVQGSAFQARSLLPLPTCCVRGAPPASSALVLGSPGAVFAPSSRQHSTSCWDNKATRTLVYRELALARLRRASKAKSLPNFIHTQSC